MKVVIVDDTHINLVLMSRLMDKLDGVSTLTFQSAQQALEWCGANPYDLLIVDYMMPDINGLELIARLPGAPDERPPVLMVTASVDIDVRHRALENGASDFLIKPIDKVEFLARTRNMLALRRATLALRHRASWLADEVGKATAELRARAGNHHAAVPRLRTPRPGNGRPHPAHGALLLPDRGRAGPVGRRAGGRAERRAHARHRQGRHARPDPAEAGPADRRGNGHHAPARRDRLPHPQGLPGAHAAIGRRDRL